MTARLDANARARAAFLRACELDVAVRKPGNVSLVSPGHGMDAAMFVRSAQAAAPALCAPGARVGRRIEAAVEASWAAAGCNTNLGIVLLCAPLATAAERLPDAASPGALRAAVESVLAGLDLQDAAAAYRAIARANPGGLGNADAEDVHHAPRLGLRAAMALAAERDSIARQYRDGFAELFEHAGTLRASGFVPGPPSGAAAPPGRAVTGGVQALFLALLSTVPDSHIVRKRGDQAAQTVMRDAAVWHARARRGEPLEADPAFAAWDEALKNAGLNPGTTADLTVATLMIAGLAGG